MVRLAEANPRGSEAQDRARDRGKNGEGSAPPGNGKQGQFEQKAHQAGQEAGKAGGAQVAEPPATVERGDH